MKKKLLEKDGFYLSLFICICLVAIGGIWFTKNNVDELASNNKVVNNSNEEDEIHLIENEDEKDVVETSTESEQNLEKAKEQTNQQSKLAYLGNEVFRGYSEKEPTYSKTLNLWEIHKGLDVSAKQGQEIKSLISGQVTKVFEDDEHGMSVEIKSKDDIKVIYSNLDENIKLKKDQKVNEGDVIGKVGNTSFVESQDGSHVHIEAFKGKELINPMHLIK